MNKVQAKRLLNVARALRESKVPADFTMELFVNVCGTPACALGHYAARRDLQHTFEVCVPTTGVWSGGIRWLTGDDVGQLCNDYGSDEFSAHFGLTEDEAQWLFGADGCDSATTPVAAAEYIEAFVRDRTKRYVVTGSSVAS